MSLRTRWFTAALAAVVLAAPAPMVAQAIAPAAAATPAGRQAAFTFAQVRSYPFPNELTASAASPRIAWAFNEQGRRNVWVAEGPDYRARQLTHFTTDDGQEITSLGVSGDGRWVVYVRGGEHGGNWDDTRPVNATASPTMPTMAIWSVPFAGGEPKMLGEGDAPVLSPKGDVVAFERGGQIWTVPVDGSAEAKRLFQVNGSNGGAQWSPDGTRLAFVSGRGDHAFVGVYTNDTTPIRWIAPSTARDGSPRWSPDGTRLVFVRRPGSGGAPDSVLVQHHNPWAIWTADARTGEARMLWTAPTTLRGSAPSTQGGTNLHWAAGDRVVFLSTMDGWPHLYSMPAGGGEPLLLTPGDYMLEYITPSPDGRFLVAAANTGPRDDDIDRRHVLRVPVDRAAPEVLTPGTGLEWTPVATGGGTIAYLSATAQRPPLPAVLGTGGTPRLLAEDRVPADFPASQLVTPRQVVFDAPDGVRVHAQLFEKAGGGEARRPAIIFVHGGPPRQMLLGWHYSDYYANTYANNQYLAAKGYVVLSVNYRLGIGYGDDFHRPPNAGARGAAEYQDVKAAAEWLARQPDVDASRIGIWGGSYGGFLTAMALARDSDLFAAGVDLHGVHDWTTERARGLMERDRYEQVPDFERALEVAWQSSPLSSMATWRSPVLLIHGDDDRNVRFSQTVDLAQRLRARGIPFEEIVIPDDTHHWMLHRNSLWAGQATAAFFDRTIGAAATPASSRR